MTPFFSNEGKEFIRREILFKFILVPLFFLSCKKLVSIPPPVSSITTSQVFADSTDANSAIDGIYSAFINYGNPSILNGFGTIFCGMSADELLPFYIGGYIYSTNVLTYQGDDAITACWGRAYNSIYQINATIEGINASAGISPVAKNQFIGEAKFLRSLVYFNLINIFGDVPFLTGSDYHVNNVAPRTPKRLIYDSILIDLKSAASLLRNDYSYSSGERVRANSLAATALLAKVYLYLGDWSNAGKEATAIINNSSTFTLNADLNKVYASGNNNEAILQWKLNPSQQPFNLTAEGNLFVPRNNDQYVNYYLTPQLLKSFEEGDKRKVAWIDSAIYAGTTYFYPYKYKNGPSQRIINGITSEYYTVLRLAEQYLIRAEAEANGADGGVAGAIADLNVIRSRAGLPDYQGVQDRTPVLNAIMQERRIEFFAEWGSRWFDLKRTGTIDSVLKPIKPLWQSYQQLYPIPVSDINLDPNLTQNPGYF